jgi:hypothetical protein
MAAADERTSAEAHGWIVEYLYMYVYIYMIDVRD